MWGKVGDTICEHERALYHYISHFDTKIGHLGSEIYWSFVVHLT